MKTTDGGARFDGRPDPIAAQRGALSQEGGVLPEDFPDRLRRLKEVSGLTWNGLAQALGVDRKQLDRWRKGTEPCGGAMLALIRFACQVPGGLDILLGDFDGDEPALDPDEEDEDGEEEQEG